MDINYCDTCADKNQCTENNQPCKDWQNKFDLPLDKQAELTTSLFSYRNGYKGLKDAFIDGAEYQKSRDAEEIERLKDELDTLCMKYLSQVGLYKSLYEEAKKIDEDKLNKIIDDYQVEETYLLGHKQSRQLNDFEKTIFKAAYKKAKENS